MEKRALAPPPCLNVLLIGPDLHQVVLPVDRSHIEVRLTTAASYREGGARLRTLRRVPRPAPPDLIVIQLEREGGNSLELLREAKAAVELDAVPILVVGDEDDLRGRARAARAGAAGYCSIGVSPAPLWAAILNLLSRVQAGATGLSYLAG